MVVVFEIEATSHFKPKGHPVAERTGARGGRTAVTVRSAVFRGVDHAHYDVGPDGERFMMLASTDSFPSQINVVLNWAQKLERAGSEN